MISAPDRLEAFERQHGDYYEILAKITGDPEKDLEVNRLLKRHHELVMCLVAWRDGYAAAQFEAKLAAESKAIAEFAGR
jgi:hypothetical protein